MFSLLLVVFCSLVSPGSFHTTVNLAVNNQVILIKTKEDLIRYAEPILFKTYGKEKIISEKPYLIIFKNGIWTMKGTLPRGYSVGGTFLIIVSARDGTIRKLTHFK
jgi:NTF2 fold immunity protein of polymorphic toxin system component